MRQRSCQSKIFGESIRTLVFAKILWYTSSQELVYKKHHLSFFVFGQNVFLHFSKCILYTYKGEQLMAFSQSYDVAIIGGGIVGMSVALRLPGHMRVALFTKGQLGESNTRYAQGGLTVALGADDSPELHFQDTLAAGAGLCDDAAVRILAEEAPAAVRWLISMRVQFDRAQPGIDTHATEDGLLLGREAAHSRWRVLDAGGDATYAEIEPALLHDVRERSSLVLYEETYVRSLRVINEACKGLEAIDRSRQSFVVHG